MTLVRYIEYKDLEFESPRSHRPKSSACRNVRKEREPFLAPDRPWEGQSTLYGSIIEEDGGYRLCYKTLVCLASSHDGLHFDKGELKGAVHPHSNFILDDQIGDFSLLRDDGAMDSRQRCKMIACTGDSILRGLAFWYRSLFLACIEIFHVHLQRLDTQLAVSRDGHEWSRLCEREVFTANGEHGEFDAYWIVPTFNPPILEDQKLLIRFNGRDMSHSVPGLKHIPPGMYGAFGLSTLREDGFVGLDATGHTGMLET